MNLLRNEKGFSTILLALMVLLVMTALGLAMLQTTIRETKSVNKLKLSTQAFYSAESGVNIAAAELKNETFDLQAAVDAFIADPDDKIVLCSNVDDADCDYDYSTLNMRFKTTISFQGEVLCYGDINNDYEYEIDTYANFLAASPAREFGKHFSPILVITSTGMNGNNKNDLFKYAERNVQIMVRREPTFVKPEMALYVGECFTNNGNPQAMIGEGPYNDQTCGADDIHTTAAAGEDCTSQDFSGDICWNTAGEPESNPLLCVDEYFVPCGTTKTVEECKAIYDTREINQPVYAVGNTVGALLHQGVEIEGGNGTITHKVHSGDPFEVHWHVGNVTINNLDGFGILVIQGDLTLGGNVNWDGLIFVDGDLTISGTGNDVINGSVMASGSVTTNGNPAVYYSCQDMDDWISDFAKWEMKWWREIKGRITL